MVGVFFGIGCKGVNKTVVHCYSEVLCLEPAAMLGMQNPSRNAESQVQPQTYILKGFWVTHLHAIVFDSVLRNGFTNLPQCISPGAGSLRELLCSPLFSCLNLSESCLMFTKARAVISQKSFRLLFWLFRLYRPQVGRVLGQEV